MKLKINNTYYTIEEWEFGQWIWITDKDESTDSYPFAYQAMQDAIDCEQRKLTEPDEEPDRYQNEVWQSWNKRDYA